MISQALLIGSLRARIKRTLITVAVSWTTLLLAVGVWHYWAAYSLVLLNGSGGVVEGGKREPFLRHLIYDEAVFLGIWVVGIAVLLLGYQSMRRTLFARDEAVEELRRSEERYRTFLDALPHGVQENNLDGIITYSNPAHARMLEMMPHHMVGRNIREFLATPDEAVRFRDYVEHLCRERPSPTPFTAKNRTVSDRIIDVVVDWRYRFDEKGTLVGFISVITDVTERKQLEAKARESREALVLALNGAGMGMWQLHVPTMTGTISDRSAQILGFHKSDISSSRDEWDKMTHPDDLARVQELLEAHLEGRTPVFDTEHRMRNASGEWVWVHGRGRITKCNDDRTPMLVSGIMTDITDRKRVEEALRESEEKFRLLTEAMVDIVWTMDLNLQTTHVSPSIELLLGFTQEERLRQTIEEQVTPESLVKIRELLTAELTKEMEGTAEPNRSVTVLVEHYKKDGSTVWLENKVRAIRDAHGMVIGLHGLSRDVTDRKRAEEELLKMERKLPMETVAHHGIRVPLKVTRS